MSPPRGITPLLQWLLAEVLERPRAELMTHLEEVLLRLNSLEDQLPRVQGLEEIESRFLEAGEAYREAAFALVAQLEHRVQGRWAYAARCVRHGAALLEQADALNYRLRQRILGRAA